MGIQNNSIPKKMNSAQIAINNTQEDAEIQTRVSQFGYPPEKMLEGKKLLDTAFQIVNAQVVAFGAQKDASSKVNTLKKTAMASYQSLARVCAAIYAKDRTKLDMLGLRGKMPQQTAAFLSAAYILFDNAREPEIQAELAKYGYDTNKLQNEREAIVKFDQANQLRELRRGSKQQSTREKQAAVKQIDDWVRQYLKIARVALKDKPELLEKLGVRILSSKTPAQRAAHSKAAKSATQDQNNE